MVVVVKEWGGDGGRGGVQKKEKTLAISCCSLIEEFLTSSSKGLFPILGLHVFAFLDPILSSII